MNKTNWYDLIIPASIIACLLVLLVPLPPFMLDMLMAGNITLAVVILLTTLNIKTSLELSVFPTVLLAATHGRLVLNVSRGISPVVPQFECQNRRVQGVRKLSE